MTKPGRMTIRAGWSVNCSSFFEKLDPKIRKRFARRLRELERLKAKKRPCRSAGRSER